MSVFLSNFPLKAAQSIKQFIFLLQGMSVFSDSDLETLDDNDDSREAFPDIEEQDLLCQGYQLKPTHQVKRGQIRKIAELQTELNT